METTEQGTATEATPAQTTNSAPAETQTPPSSSGQEQTQGAEPNTEQKAEAGAPEEYAEFTVPEGLTLDAELTGEFKDLAKKMGLTQENAQNVADLGVKMLQKWGAAQQEAVIAQQAQWAEASRSDKEFGGDAFESNLAIAKKAVDALATPELRQLLDSTGLGSHPDMIRAFYRAGKALSEDTLVTGQGQTVAAPRTFAEAMYGS